MNATAISFTLALALAGALLAATAEGIKNLYLLTDMGQIDCLGSISGLGDFDGVIGYSRALVLDFGSVRLLDFEGLIKAKSAMKALMWA